MKISTVMTFHNELEFLPGWFASATKYSDEIILAAHDPKDGSLEFVKEYAKNSSIPVSVLEFPRDTIYKHGFSYMKNQLLERVTGDWIVSLDADEEMEITKESLELFTNRVCASTVTMHLQTEQAKPHWSLDNREQIKIEADWIKQRHWRIHKNGFKIKWMGLIHEELRFPSGLPAAINSYPSQFKMYHFGALANPSKRTFKDGLYAELLLRVIENPELRMGTNEWWWQTYFPENKVKLLKDREQYRKENELNCNIASC